MLSPRIAASRLRTLSPVSMSMSEVASSRRSKSPNPFQAAKPWWVDHHNEGDIEVASIHASQSLTHRTYSRAAQALAQTPRETRPLLEHVPLPVKCRWADLSDSEIQKAVESGELKFFDLEKELEDEFRAVKIRRSIIAKRSKKQFSALPYEHFDYQAVIGQSCENVIGYATIPVGVAGPLLVDGKEYYVPMATTEGCLVASTTRGCKAISMSGGASTVVYGDGMSRAPVLSVPDVATGAAIKFWVEANLPKLAEVFNATSRYAKLTSVNTLLAGRKVFIRFKCTSGDAMGMNMVGKGVEKALEVIREKFPSSTVISLSGNVCTDKKPSAINWIEGRGKSVVCEATIKGEVVNSVLKTSVAALVELNYSKNLIGSSIAGSIGGNNAHASNVVTAIFLATGQDPAQNVESSNCLTLLEAVNDGKDLHISCTLPSLEVGTVGGGTHLPGQSAMLTLLDVKGSSKEEPGRNAATLARIIGATVMAGELSLLSALCSGALIKSHMKLNRRQTSETVCSK